MDKPKWYRLPKKEKEKKALPPTVRKRSKNSGPDVLYMNKDTYRSSPPKKESSAKEFLDRLNETFNTKLTDDIDHLLSEVYKRGWKISTMEFGKGSKYVIRFHREVGDSRSRIFVEKGNTMKKVVLMALERVLAQEKGRYEKRIKGSRKK
tara:strand:+ start:587 stop:1036 length:450 start_codon:yes stop_codon:yes gene_type:complete